MSDQPWMTDEVREAYKLADELWEAGHLNQSREQQLRAVGLEKLAVSAYEQRLAEARARERMPVKELRELYASGAIELDELEHDVEETLKAAGG